MGFFDTGEGTPWGPKKYQDPGAYKANQDPSTQASYLGSPMYAQFQKSVAANRAATDRGTAALGGQPGADPYAASRENAAMGLEGQIGHQAGEDQKRLLAEENNRRLQEWLQSYQDNEQEDAERGEFYDKAGRTANNGFMTLLNAYTGGSLGNTGKKGKKDTKPKAGTSKGGK